MPRLLLVDDNPSIHRSAEIQLGPTGVELVYAGSAEEALGMVQAGATFDAALIDILMPGTDGWELLRQLRAHPATARTPIAFMAGVLEEVDPARVEAAGVQGFLKKPTEFGRLADRVQQLMATPVPEDGAGKATVPTTPLEDLVTLPETRGDEAPVIPVSAALPDDVLVLTEADLFPEAEPAAALVEATVAEPPPLELEDLDLSAVAPAHGHAPSEPTPLGLPAVAPDLGPTWEEVPEVVSPVAEAPALSMATDLPDLGPDLDLAPLPELAAPTAMAEEEAAPEPALAPAVVAAPGAMASLAPAVDSGDLLQRLLADPAALDALAKAVVARLGDQVLREIAWEIMPDLADKLRK